MIAIFSIDAFNRDKWNLPFIRLGSNKSNALILSDSISNPIAKFELPLSEFLPIYYISKNILEFGNPSYIGFCHYRRFFANINKYNNALVQFPQECDIDDILTPSLQYEILKTNLLDGFTPTPFVEHFHLCNNIETKHVYEEFYLLGVEDKSGLSLETYKLAYDNLTKFMPNKFGDAYLQACNQRRTHFGSIFTLKQELFNIYCEIIIPTIINTICEMNYDELYNSNSRSFGYILERLTSLILYTFKFYGYKIINMPLIVSNCDFKPKYRHFITKDIMKCDVENFKKEFYIKK